MKGFKSFARETNVPFDKNVVCVVGPNGSGKSNITDALCFVLGRLSIKSIRAAKASHLIFSGNKEFKGASQGYVEIVLDNEEKTFALDNKEIKLRRTVKKNGQSTYKINDETRTRQEVLELLSQAGIDPHGFNIVLQGEIEKFVKNPPDDRRKVIEEVAGISVYEMRKTKSLKELDRTEEKLKQINAVLRERTNYLRNLENEREQALRFKKLEIIVKRCKASIIQRNIQTREKELKENNQRIESKIKDISKIELNLTRLTNEIKLLEEKINTISETIQKSSGLEQDTLNREISEFKQEIAGLIARKENFENNLVELDRRKHSLEETTKNYQKEIQEMSKEKGNNRKKELEEKKAKLDELNELKRKHYLIKSNLSSTTTQLEDKKRQLQRIKNESNFILNQLEQIEKEIKIKETLDQHREALVNLKQSMEDNKEKVSSFEGLLLEKEKIKAIEKQKIIEAEKIKSDVSKLDTCPLCQTQITKEHIGHVMDDSDSKIKKANEMIINSNKKIDETRENIEKTKEAISRQAIEINIRNIDLVKIQNIFEKKEQLKRNNEQLVILEKEFKDLEAKKKTYENNISKTKLSEEQFESLQLEVNELQRTEERDLGFELTQKQRELDRTQLAIKQNSRDKEDITDNLEFINASLEEKESITEKKEEQAEVLKKKYQKMFEEKNLLQDRVRRLESSLLRDQNEKRVLEGDTNNFKITKAQISAKKDTLTEELFEFKGVEFLSLPIEKLKEKLHNSETTLIRIGSVNMRALEVYEGIKAEYDKIKDKVEMLEKEKDEILRIIIQIDKKKKKAFIQTLDAVNEQFSRNFSQLSTKGIVSIQPQDKKEIFNAGLDILVNVGGGKKFDVTSLSGGEQTLVALSLIFAIQEYRPYYFYIFDEIDAALDKRNSEKLGYLLKKHMKKGQYLIITHNDSIISESSNVIYGVSMQEGISKVLSIEV